MTVDPKQETTRSRPITSARRSAALLQGAPHEQIAAAIADGHISRSVELLQQHGERLLVDGAADSLQEWLSALPDGQFQQSNRLALLASWVAIYQQRFRDAATHLAQAERALQTKMIAYDAGTRLTGDFLTRPFADALTGINAVKAHLRAINGEEPDADASVDGMMLAASADHPVWRAEALVVLGRCRFLSGDAAAATRDLSDAVALASTTGSARARRAEGEALVLLGYLASYAGHPDQAAAHFAAVSPDAGSATAAARIGQAQLALDALDIARAERLLAETSALRSSAVNLDPLTVIATGSTTAILVAALKGEHQAAQSQFDHLEREFKQTEFRWLLELIQPVRTRLAVLRKDEPLLRRHVQQASIARGPVRGLGEIRRQLALSVAHLQLNNFELAAKSAEAARLSTHGSGLHRITAEADLYASLARLGSDGSAQDLTRLDDALTALAKASVTLPLAFVEGAPVMTHALAADTKGAVRAKLEVALAACRAELSSAVAGTIALISVAAGHADQALQAAEADEADELAIDAATPGEESEDAPQAETSGAAAESP